MTAREGAVIRPEKRAMKAMVGVATAGRYVTPGSAMRLLDYLADAGLRIVDAEMFDALVAAVRGYQWAGESFKLAAQHGTPLMDVIEDYLHIASACSDVADAAHTRAVELLEKGE